MKERAKGQRSSYRAEGEKHDIKEARDRGRARGGAGREKDDVPNSKVIWVCRTSFRKPIMQEGSEHRRV